MQLGLQYIAVFIKRKYHIDKIDTNLSFLRNGNTSGSETSYTDLSIEYRYSTISSST